MYQSMLILGKIIKDIEISNTIQGTPMCEMVVAVDEWIKSSQDAKTVSTLFTVVLFGKNAENASTYLNKGSVVLVSGRMQDYKWTDDEGNRQSKWKLIAKSVKYIPSPGAYKAEDIKHDTSRRDNSNKYEAF